MKNDMGVMQSKYSEPVTLRGQADAPDAAAKIFCQPLNRNQLNDKCCR